MLKASILLMVLMGTIEVNEGWTSKERTSFSESEPLLDELAFVRYSYRKYSSLPTTPTEPEDDESARLLLRALQTQKPHIVVSVPSTDPSGYFSPALLQAPQVPSSLPIEGTNVFTHLVTRSDNFKQYSVCFRPKGFSPVSYDVKLYKLSITLKSLKENPLLLINLNYRHLYTLAGKQTMPASCWDDIWFVSGVERQDTKVSFTLKQSAKTLKAYEALPSITVIFKRLYPQAEEGIFEMEI